MKKESKKNCVNCQLYDHDKKVCRINKMPPNGPCAAYKQISRGK